MPYRDLGECVVVFWRWGLEERGEEFGWVVYGEEGAG